MFGPLFNRPWEPLTPSRQVTIPNSKYESQIGIRYVYYKNVIRGMHFRLMCNKIMLLVTFLGTLFFGLFDEEALVISDGNAI